MELRGRELYRMVRHPGTQVLHSVIIPQSLLRITLRNACSRYAPDTGGSRNQLQRCYRMSTENSGTTPESMTRTDAVRLPVEIWAVYTLPSRSMRALPGVPDD